MKHLLTKKTVLVVCLWLMLLAIVSRWWIPSSAVLVIYALATVGALVLLLPRRLGLIWLTLPVVIGISLIHPFSWGLPSGLIRLGVITGLWTTVITVISGQLLRPYFVSTITTASSKPVTAKSLPESKK